LNTFAGAVIPSTGLFNVMVWNLVVRRKLQRRRSSLEKVCVALVMRALFQLLNHVLLRKEMLFQFLNSSLLMKEMVS
jgi:hypothetical protein